MLSTLFSSPISFLLFAINLLIAITVHEFAHAFAADKLGDPTPRVQGRLSLNPLRHLDPLGTLAILTIGFGWGKPVQIDPYNLQKPRQDQAIISFAGPLSNLTLALLSSLVLRIFPLPFLSVFLFSLIYLNVMLAIFNLVPIGPLDGQKILAGILPRDLAFEFDSIMRRYGTLILILFIFPIFTTQSPITSLISPVISYLVNLLL